MPDERTGPAAQPAEQLAFTSDETRFNVWRGRACTRHRQFDTRLTRARETPARTWPLRSSSTHNYEAGGGASGARVAGSVTREICIHASAEARSVGASPLDSVAWKTGKLSLEYVLLFSSSVLSIALSTDSVRREISVS